MNRITCKKGRCKVLFLGAISFLLGGIVLFLAGITSFQGCMQWLDSTPFMGNLQNPNGTKVQPQGGLLMVCGVGLFVGSIVIFSMAFYFFKLAYESNSCHRDSH